MPNIIRSLYSQEILCQFQKWHRRGCNFRESVQWYIRCWESPLERHSNRGANLWWLCHNLVWTFQVKECLWFYPQSCDESTRWFESQACRSFGDLIMEFINYVRSFYGPGGIYDMKATDAMIIDATIQYLTTPGIHWADGDSFDREHVRDIMIKRFGLVAVWELAQGGLQCPPIPDKLHSFLRNLMYRTLSDLRDRKGMEIYQESVNWLWLTKRNFLSFCMKPAKRIMGS